MSSAPGGGGKCAVTITSGPGMALKTEFPSASANAVGILTERAEELDVETISDLEGVSEDLTLAGHGIGVLGDDDRIDALGAIGAIVLARRD